jgi:hypothetical protein
MKKLKKFTIEALRREMPVLGQEEQREYVGGDGWITFSGNYMDYLSDYVTNTPDSIYVEQSVYILKNGTKIAYQDPNATATSGYQPYSIHTVGSAKTTHLPLEIKNSGFQYSSEIDSVIHTHKNGATPSGIDSLNHIPGVKQFIFYNGNLIPY